MKNIHLYLGGVVLLTLTLASNAIFIARLVPNGLPGHLDWLVYCFSVLVFLLGVFLPICTPRFRVSLQKQVSPSEIRLIGMVVLIVCPFILFGIMIFPAHGGLFIVLGNLAGLLAFAIWGRPRSGQTADDRNA
jgi:ABC-type uncharacterized transport system permease subunit